MDPHPDADKRIMLELANTHPELPPPYGVFKTNAVSTSLSQGGLFPLLSRVNSSCRPNLTRPLWDQKDGVIRCWAGRDIEEGEELVRLTAATAALCAAAGRPPWSEIADRPCPSL